MPNALQIPQTAPFSDEDRDTLGTFLSGASLQQRAWLSGFLAGFDVSATTPAQAPASKAARPLTILFLSESGNSERLAHDIAKVAKSKGFRPRVVDFADIEIGSLEKEKSLLVVAATWGEGDPPARAARAYAAFMADSAPRLESVEFGVLALGDTAYAAFCAVGKAIDERLEALGGKRVAARVDCDLDFEAAAAAWIKTAIQAFKPAASDESPAASNVVAIDFAGRAGTEPSREPTLVEVREHVNLNSSRSAKETIHLALGFDGPIPAYEPGDSLEVFAPNDPATVEAVAKAAGIAHDDRLRASLTSDRDIATLSLPLVTKYAALIAHDGLQREIEEGRARDWIDGRQFIDLLEAYPASLSADQLLSLTRPLPPRAYSIASSRHAHDDEAHLLVAAVRYESHGRARSGVASTHVADRVKTGAQLRVRLKPNKHFRLPDPATDIIMVGPGTGVAPFRAFVQERAAIGATGRNWLFYGDRQYTHDFLYQLEWQEALTDGALTRLDLAFSRDTPDKIYVQHRIWEQRRDLVDWLEGGARFYVCGDAKAMAKDVRTALVRSFADVKQVSVEAAEAAVADLERSRRYLQDVY